MVKLTPSLFQYLWDNHRDIVMLVKLGHTELVTDDIWDSYIKWCLTDEGKKYLKGGSEYREDLEGGV